MTSSDENLIIGLGVGLGVFFISLVGILYACYKRKKVELSKKEDQARDLRKLKYI